jgi:hypothetical protein
MSRKSQRKADRRQLVEAMKSYVEFPWDYSYIPWKDWQLDLRREFVRHASMFGRTWIVGRTSTQMDVPLYAARRLYNENWDGCRDWWKANYRASKHPESSPPPRYAQTKIIGWFSRRVHDCRESTNSKQCPRADTADHEPLVRPPNPKTVEHEHQASEHEQAKHKAFNRRQEQCYATWLRRRRSAHVRLWQDVAP